MTVNQGRHNSKVNFLNETEGEDVVRNTEGDNDERRTLSEGPGSTVLERTVGGQVRGKRL